ncbi:MAG: cytochrome b5 domain-containing protein [Cytophagales bacterium]
MADQSLLPVYTRSQLALRNGQDKEEVWIAYKGNIYDVSRSKLWRKGMHYEHWAGQDLTHELPDAPHNANVFDKFEIIGVLDDFTPNT